MHAQVLKRVLNNAKDKAIQKANEKVDRAIDNTVDGTGKKKTPTKNGGADNTNNSPNKPSSGTVADSSKTNDSTATNSSSLITYSKYDFVPGEKIVAYEDFSQEAIGDFPAKWNTNSSGEVVTASNQQGHWLMVPKKGRFVPMYMTTLPDNFTFEYDVICNEKFSYYSPALDLFFLTGKNGKETFEYSFIPLEKRSGVKIGVHPTNGANNGGSTHIESFEDGASVIKNEVNTIQFNSVNGKTKLHVSIWRQTQRVRVYLNEEKVFDLPRAFPADKIYSTVLFDIWTDMNNEKDRFLISNIKLAVGAPDTRNKLITEGKFVTRGILFDVNSDKIKPESYGTLKDIANVLTENAGVKVMIIGHTDSDGDDNSNLDLSKRRAESVKNALVQNFSIDASRLQTDGKGETQPVDNNNTTEGKANNRRVEFVKM
jgi:outer membrane protein OmpA-like peptidoglycan-associated protein